jgi:hypothetical protein
MFFLMLFACATQEAETTCEALCDHLVMTCDYAAYPTLDSCVQGCSYQAEQGGDVVGQQTCIEKAQCDTFGILECEHKFGAGE